MPGRHLEEGKHRADEQTWWQEWGTTTVVSVFITSLWLAILIAILWVLANTPVK